MESNYITLRDRTLLKLYLNSLTLLLSITLFLSTITTTATITDTITTTSLPFSAKTTFFPDCHLCTLSLSPAFFLLNNSLLCFVDNPEEDYKRDIDCK